MTGLKEKEAGGASVAELETRDARSILVDLDPTDWCRFGIVVDALDALGTLFNVTGENREEGPTGAGVFALLRLMEERLSKSLDEQGELYFEMSRALRLMEEKAA